MANEIISSIFTLLVGKLQTIGFNLGQIVTLAAFFIFYKYSFSPLSSKVSEMKNKFDDLHNATWEMQSHLGKPRKQSKLDPLHKLDKLSWATSNSPFILNEKGQGLLKASGMDEIVSNNLKNLISKLEECKPETKYDVDSYSIKVLEDFVHTNAEIEKQIKIFLHNNPVYDGKEVGFNDLFFIGSLQISNSYIENHPELS